MKFRCADTSFNAIVLRVQTPRPIKREGRGGGGGRWWIKNAYFTSQGQLLLPYVRNRSAGNTGSLKHLRAKQKAYKKSPDVSLM